MYQTLLIFLEKKMPSWIWTCICLPSVGSCAVRYGWYGVQTGQHFVMLLATALRETETRRRIFCWRRLSLATDVGSPVRPSNRQTRQDRQPFLTGKEIISCYQLDYQLPMEGGFCLFVHSSVNEKAPALASTVSARHLGVVPHSYQRFGYFFFSFWLLL